MRYALALMAGCLLTAGGAQAEPQAPAVQKGKTDLTWVEEVDFARLNANPDYARSVIERLDTIDVVPDRRIGNTSAADALGSLRIRALLGAADPGGATAFAQKVAVDAADAPVTRAMAVLALTRANRRLEAIDAIEHAAKRIRSAENLSIFRQGLGRAVVHNLFYGGPGEASGDALTRLMLALARLGWPGDIEPSETSGIKRTAAAVLFARGEKQEAKTLVDAATEPSVVAELLTMKSMDSLNGEVNRETRVVQAMATEDERSVASLARSPDDVRLVRARVKYLRAADRSQEAFDVGAPFVMDMDVLRRMFTYWGSDLLWLANEMAYVMVDLDRGEEANALLTSLETLDVEKHGAIINMMINRLGLMATLGRYEDVAAFAVSLADDRGAGQATPYGEMWIWAAAACAYHNLGRGADAKPWIDKVASGRESNVSAHLQVLLCTRDEAGAEALMIERLGSNDPTSAVMLLQDFLDGPEDEEGRIMKEQVAKLKASPAVRTAFDKVAHRIKMPMRRVYWTL